MSGTDPALLGRMAAAIRGGQLDAAAMMAAGAIGPGTSDPVLLAMAGTVECMRGQFARAAPWLARALVQRPDDPVIRANLVDARFRIGDHDGARALCDLAAARADQSLRIARIGGHLAQEAGDLAAALAFYGHVVATQPADWATWNNLGNTLLADGRPAEAVTALRRALALAEDAPPVHVNLAQALVQAGGVDEAEAVLRAAAARFPDDAHPCAELFRLMHDQGRGDEAWAVLGMAAARAPADPDIRADHGHVATLRDDHAIAEADFEAALAAAPAHTAALVGLAAVYERANRHEALAPLRARASAAGAAPSVIAFVDALRLKRENDFAGALAALDSVGDEILDIHRFALRGLLLDRLGRSDEAFAAFAAMNAATAADPADPRARAAGFRAALAAETPVMTPAWAAGWTPAPPADRPSPLFIVGFPRSGTTLLDTMLMAVPQVRVLEEEPFIGDLHRAVGGIGGLAAMSGADILAARETYWQRAGAAVDLAADTVLVDKHPMHLAKVPMIRRLFPDARFILALRHPCDVVLSCLMANFRPNEAMANFLDPGDAAALYDATFAQWRAARAAFDLPVAEVVYERLVADPEGELAPLFAWAGLPWPEGGMDHRAAARARGTVRTASYAQVTEPLYARAAGRWRRYAAHLAPVLPALAPWAEAFGYGIADDRIPERPA